jgi:VWFA-related protein
MKNPSSFIRAIVVITLFVVATMYAQDPKPQPTSPDTTKPPTQPAPAEAGGPQSDTGAIAIPKKKTEDAPQKSERKPQMKNPEGIGDYSLRVNVGLVNVDVSVLTKDGQFIPGLKADNFRVLEDGIPQKVNNFAQSEAPITAVLLLEFANTNGSFLNDMLTGAYSFFNTLKKDDYVAVVSFDMRSRIEVDFTQDKREVVDALNHMRIPGFREINTFDALYDTLDRIEGIDGRKYIILIGTGLDTFSKITYDKILAKVKASHNITIFTISTGAVIRIQNEGRGGFRGTLRDMEFLQADNAMKSFANMTGGQFYAPRFAGEMVEDFQYINAAIRNQYTLTFRPTNTKQDGTYRKLKVEIINPVDGSPLRVVDQKGKALKYMVISRDGYKAKQVVE